MMTFSIPQWTAWAPGLSRADQWQRWFDAPHPPDGSRAAPTVDFLPPLQRRRLSRLARQVFHCAWPLALDREPMPLVLLSRHGETPRSFELLDTLAQDEPLSPTAFSLSVHNAILGLWSIVRGETEEHVALSAGNDLGCAFLEATALLHDHTAGVLLVVAEEEPPDAYLPWVDDVPFPYAAALRLTPGTDWQLRRRQPDDPSSPSGADLPHCPPIVSLLCHLARGSVQPWHTATAGDWVWQCTSAP